MISYLSADLVDSTSSEWTTSAFELAIAVLRRDLESLEKFELIVSQGDSFQIQCSAKDGWLVALLTYFRMRQAAKPGARVAFSVGESDNTKGRPLGLRNGLVYQSAGRGVKQLHDQDLRFGFFPTDESGLNAGWAVASNYAEVLLRSTTTRQCELLSVALQEHRFPKQEQIAREFNLAKSTVSQHLAAGNYALHIKTVQQFSSVHSKRTD